MPNEDEQESGASGAEGGAQSDKGKEGGEEGKGKPKREYVPLEDHKRAVDDAVKNKKLLKDAEARLNAIETERLREKEDFKGLADRTIKERDELKEQLTKSQSTFAETLKFNRVREAALKAGIRPEAMDDLESLDLNEIEVETTSSGRFSVRGADAFVENLKKKKSFWFQDPKAPKFNSGGGNPPPDGDDGKMDENKLWALEKKHGRDSKIFKEAWDKAYGVKKK